MNFTGDIWQLIFIPVLAWLALTNIQHGKKLAVIEKVLDGLVTKMDLFLKTEIDTLKELARRDD
jgi:hypothetical protein